MEYPSRWKSRGTIKLGKIVFKNKVKHSFNLSVEDLAQHMFITGITGTGKSNFLQNFLIEFTKHHPDIPFLITEFKGEYHHLQDRIGDLLILKPGENFSLNIFDPQAVNYQIHAERVFKIFESGGLLENIDYSPQMEAVFVEILRTVIGNPKFRSWKGFERISKQYLRDHKDLTYKKSVIAVQNRIRRYYVGTLKQIFDTKSSVTVQDLFSHKVLLDLHPIIKLGGEKEDALFFLNMVLKYLWDRNIVLGSRDYAGIRHVTIIEDAQYFAPQELSARTKLTSYIEDIALLLRGTGECLITLATRPNISKEILSNAGVLVCFQLHMQKDLMKQLLNLQEWQEKYLSELKKGQCVVRVNSVEKPFALQCDYVKRHWLSDEQIRKNNRRIIESKINKVEQKIEKKMEEIKVKNPELIQEIENSNPSTEKKSFDQMLREKRAFCKLCK
ncbi:MAG: ATP-binding protein, partial [Candidatus Hermodarchaeota archaeon]